MFRVVQRDCMSSLGTGIVLHIVDPSLWSVHVDDSFREITFILRYILLRIVYRQSNSIGLHWTTIRFE